MTGAVTYKRFAVAAEAIRYAIEVLPATSFLGAYLEANEERLDSQGIRELYDSVEYPLPRRPTEIQDRPLGNDELPRAGHGPKIPASRAQ
jgi:hypothetical protein